jgi:hypothetical protein
MSAQVAGAVDMPNLITLLHSRVVSRAMRALTPLCAAGLASLLCAALAVPAVALQRRRNAQVAAGAQAVPVGLSINQLEPGRPVPGRFLGLSFEAAALAQLGRYGDRGDLVAMLRSLGPGILRFGGITADENVGWSDGVTPPPPWASSVIGPAQLRGIGLLARRSGWRVLLTVGLAHYEPQAAAREVAAAHRALGPYLAAVEIGNEPEAYARHGFREPPWLPQSYEEQISDYREAISALTPGVPIAGPDSSGSGSFLEWGFAEALSQAPAMLTGHHYPLGCAQTPPPTTELLLSAATRGREAASLETYMSISRTYRIPLRIDEAGSVSCGGVPGISNTFASALWATGYIASTMASGAAGINLQGNPTNCLGYTPLCALDSTASSDGALHAQPDWYALLLARSLIGFRPLPTTIEAPATPNLAASSFLGPRHTVKLVLADDEAPGSAPLSVSVEIGPGMGPAQVLRLTGPSPQATSGVLLGGRAVSADGIWHAPAHPETRAVHGGVLTVALAPSSAAIVTVSPAPARPRHRHSRAKRSG